MDISLSYARKQGLAKLKYAFFGCITQHEHIIQIFIQEIFHKIKYY